MALCYHTNVIVSSFQVSNVNAPVSLELDEDNKVVSFQFKNPLMDRANGILSAPVLRCVDCNAEFTTGSVVEPSEP